MNSLAEISSRFRALHESRRIGPIGLHVADEQLHAVQLCGASGGPFTLRGWSSVSYSGSRSELLKQGDSFKLLVKQALKRGRFRGRRVVTTMPPENLKTSALTFTADPNITDGERILQLMANRLDEDLSDFVLDYIPIRAKSSDTERVVMVARCRRADVLAYLQCLTDAGLEVDALEIGPIAIKRLMCCLPDASASANTLIVNFGWDKTYLTVISGRRVLLDQEVDFGERMIIDRIAKSLDMTDTMARELVLREGLGGARSSANESRDDVAAVQFATLVDIVRPLFTRLAQEVKRACMYAAAQSQGVSISRVYLLGSIARWPGADELLAKMADIPVSELLLLTDLLNGDRGAEAVTIGPDLALATGLALRGFGSDD